MGRIRQVYALALFEIHQQRREPLTTLYALVFFLLAFGYTASGAVELVGDRGDVPKQAPWALALAFGGLTAFGQVITTMVAATALLRDDALRTLPMIATSSVSPRVWFVGRLGATLAVLAAVYAAMPIGAMLGAQVSASATDASAAAGLRTPATSLWTYLITYLRITVPTCLVVATVLAAAALFTRRVLGVLAAALLLVGLWQLSLALVAQASTQVLGALLDPFGNAPVLAMTADWSGAERRLRDVSLDGVLLWNRLLWLGVSTGVAAVAIWKAQWPERRQAAAARAAIGRRGPVAALAAGRRDDRAQTSAVVALRRFTSAWMTRDGGWRAVMLLAAANALVNAWTRAPAQASMDTLLLLVSEHARLFLILLATVYAGELLWRERDTRVDALIDTTPVSTRALALGRLAGLFLAQSQVVLLLAVGALLVVVAQAIGDATRTVAASLSAETFTAWFVFVLWLPFAQLTALSLAVHALVRHKVFAHLLLITGWVLAVVLDRNGATAWWYRVAEPATLMDGSEVAWAALGVRAAWWTAWSALLLLYTVVRWPRGERTTVVPTTARQTRRA